jgi:hypothetical protein
MRKLFLVIPLAGLLAAGCASASAKGKAPVDRPALTVPPPPARVIEPAPEPPPEPVSDLPVVPSPTPPGRSPRPATPRPPANDKADAKAEASTPVEPVIEPVAPPPQAPPAQLRTPETSDSSGAAKNVRATIDRTRNILNTVDYGPLSKDRKKAYNDAKLFLEQAEDGLKQGNVVFAQAVAIKAETLARELANR